MTITVGGTTITFNDATTQTTAPVNTNANVTSVSAGTGISVSSTTGAVVVSASGGGTVSSVATGNGLTGGTITTSGTISLDYYTGSTSTNTSFPIGSYLWVGSFSNSTGQSATTNNQSASVKVVTSGALSSAGAGYTTGNSNGNFGASALAGVWRGRGTIPGSCCGVAIAGVSCLVQRTA